ncbi:MAG: 4Fe-4S binding protein [Candidatus Omnitrophica bacterium]|nr:4Fe-4S binding protein [Candidatus Omnitrophota bacterium]
MKVYESRFLIQSISFAVLTYGGRLGLRLGHWLPCFACPYVGSCSGHCYLMALQRSQWGFQIPFAEFISVWGLRALGMFAGFVLLTLVLSKAWCGWICPFGTLQDWIAFLRRKLGIKELQFSWSLRDRLKPIKYIFLILLIVIPILIANAGLHSDFGLPFCQICPAKKLMPIFQGNFRYFAVDVTNPITVFMTIVSLILTAVFFVGMFFKDRFFCLFCPLLAMISFFDKIGFVRLKKKVDACTSCGNCQRICPVDIREVHLEKEKKNVLTQDCMLCLKCVESCPQDGVLSFRFLNKTIFSSSKNYISKCFIKKKR